MTGPVCVVIPAFNAAETIGETVRSVMAHSEVGKVVVVDDCSRDQTGQVAEAAANGDPRLIVLRHEVNRGPSAARNLALAATDLPLLAIVDADDIVLPGRFARLLSATDGGWDFIADNVAFVSQLADLPLANSGVAPTDRIRRMGLEEFVIGNIAQADRHRGELGFLKPVFRRAFLERFGLRYDERLRLGEDFILYARALAHGARFLVSGECGYVAIQRDNSLSGSHRTQDLEALYAADTELRIAARDLGITGGTLAILDQHRAGLADKVAARQLLDDARQYGRTGALARRIVSPLELTRSLRSLRRDRPSSRAQLPSPVRFLLDDQFFTARA